MNYIELINLFWQTRRRVDFSSSETDLYFFLLHESNIRNWQNPFECSNRLICASIGMSEKTLIDVRNRLQQKGLISFESGQRKKKGPVYKILYCKNESINVSNEVSINVSKTVSKNPNLLINKTETKTEEIKIEEKPLSLVFPFTSDLFFEKWNLLVSTPKWKNKILGSLQIALDTLAKYDETFSIEMINQAIVGEWAMFKGFEIDEYFKKYKSKDSDTKAEKQKRFIPPTLEEVKAYCIERKNNVDTQRFVDFYQSKGWLVGKVKMKDWRACVRTWEKEVPKYGRPLIDVQAIEKAKDVHEISLKAKELRDKIQKVVSDKIKEDNPNIGIEDYLEIFHNAWRAEYCKECEMLGIDKSIYNQFTGKK